MLFCFSSISLALGQTKLSLWGPVWTNTLKLAGIQLVYEKLLKTKYSYIYGEKQGKLITVAGKDLELFTRLWVVALLPVNIIVVVMCCTLSYLYLGISGLIGLGTSLALIPLQIFLIQSVGKSWTQTSVYTDQRTSIVSDMIEGMKLLKFYYWEKAFKE